MIEHKRKILLIDDDEDDYLLLKDIFKGSCETVELQWAKEGEEALDYLRHYDREPLPSLILLDLNMPKLSGHEVLRQIKQNDRVSHVPVIVLTNSMNKEEAADAYRAGVASFIRKPSGFKELREFASVFCKYWFDYSTLV